MLLEMLVRIMVDMLLLNLSVLIRVVFMRLYMRSRSAKRLLITVCVVAVCSVAPLVSVLPQGAANPRGALLRITLAAILLVGAQVWTWRNIADAGRPASLFLHLWAVQLCCLGAWAVLCLYTRKCQLSWGICWMISVGYQLLYLMRIAEWVKRGRTEATYLRSLEADNHVLRGIRHDCANIIATIQGYAELGDHDGLSRYTAQLQQEVVHSQTSESLRDLCAHHPVLYGILSAKQREAEEKGVVFRVFLQQEAGIAYCSDLDLSRLVGILLDNALEAAMETTGREVVFRMQYQRGRSRIVVQNSYAGPVDLSKINQRGYSTKGSSRGEGLFQAQQILVKYNRKGYAMELQTQYTDGELTQTLLL